MTQCVSFTSLNLEAQGSFSDPLSSNVQRLLIFIFGHLSNTCDILKHFTYTKYANTTATVMTLDHEGFEFQ